jgi:hypothetical protein
VAAILGGTVKRITARTVQKITNFFIGSKVYSQPHLNSKTSQGYNVSHSGLLCKPLWVPVSTAQGSSIKPASDANKKMSYLFV